MDDAQSHLVFFGLREQPFAPTADPLYFYATREHKECLFRLWHSIDAQHGIALVLGSYGTGKTVLLRKLLTGMADAQKRYNTAVIGSPIPSWTSFALLEAILSQFGLRVATRSFAASMETLNQYLLRNRDRVSTLIIDDAQNLNKRGQLELLRLVQNLETQQRKLLNLVLFAQLEWLEVLRAAPNFEQRINMTFTLSPIPIEETERLIAFRLEQAGLAPDAEPVFDDGAVAVIHAYSEGNPRVIVTLCRNALLVASQIGKRRITPDVIMHTIEKTTPPDAEKRARALGAARLAPLPAPEPVTSPSVTPVRAYPGPTRGSREERASLLLLKAAARRKTPG